MIRAGSTNYVYDAEGRRVSGAQYEYLYDLAGHAVTLLDKTTHAWVRGEVFAQGQHIATYGNGTTYFAHPDHLGSERMRTDINGNPCQTTAHLPFGDNQTSTGNCNPSALSFTGDEHDTESSLEHTQFRQLNTLAGRWMSPDPYAGSADITNPQSLNRYAYVLNAPLAFSDPLGLICSGADGSGKDIVPCNNSHFFHDGDWPITIYQTGFIYTGTGYETTINYFSQFGGNFGNSLTTSLTCQQIASGQLPKGTFSNWVNGYVDASRMTDQFLAGTGPTNRYFGPDSVQSQQMLGAPGLSTNIGKFLAGGRSSGFQQFGLSGLVAAGLNPTAQFVGGYGYSMSQSGGALNTTITNTTTPYSLFYHAPIFNPNPPTRSNGTPLGRVNQIFRLRIPCS